MHADLEALQANEKEIAVETEETERPLMETERSKLLAIVLGMAMDAYGFNPQASKNVATGENKGSIHAALQKQGLSVDADTIRKYLTDASKMYYSARPPKS
jgi:hypothetical protein